MLVLAVPLQAKGAGEAPPASLVIGLMPAVDSIPLVVAASEGYFADEGIEVTFEVFRDQLYREAALQANRIDATVTDLVNAIRAWESGADYRVLISTQGLFSFVTAPGSTLRSADRWPAAPETVETGLLRESIINYTAIRMLEAAGLDASRVEIVPTRQIPVRMEMVIAGELEAAVLPEPMARMAIASGAGELLNTEVLDWTPGVILATGTALREKPVALAALLRSYNRAVEAVNRDPDVFRTKIAETLSFPEAAASMMRIPRYLQAAPPTAEQIADVSNWMIEIGLSAQAPQYEEIVASQPFSR